MTECLRPPDPEYCEKCGTEKQVPPLCSLLACPKCDMISTEEAAELLSQDLTDYQEFQEQSKDTDIVVQTTLPEGRE